MISKKKPIIVYYSACALVPVVLCCAVLAALGVVPFGQNTLLFGDAFGQYRAFFSAYGQLAANPLYTLHKALGGEALSLSGYYLFSPFNLILLFFSAAEMGRAFTLLYLLKIAAAGLTMGHLCRRRAGGVGPLPVALATAWALCAYMVGFEQNIMWLDALILLPLMVLGIDRILAGGSVRLYLGALSAAILVCYYTGYMLCIFSVLYFLAQAGSGQLHRPRDLLRYGGASLVAGGLQAWLYITAYAALSQGKADATFQLTPKTDFTLPQFLRLLLPASWSGQATNNDLPLVYCGALAVGLCLFWFATRRPLRQKLCAAALLGVLYASLYFHALGLCWQGFQEPTWFGWRFSFVFSFVVLDLAARALPSLPRLRALPLILALLLCAELTFNAHYTFRALDPLPAADTDTLTTAQALLARREDTTGRTESTIQLSQNDPFLLNYNGITHFSSSYSADVLTFLRSVGYTVTSGWSRYGAGSTAAANSLLGIQTLLADQADSRYPTLASQDGLLLLQNPNALPLGFACAATNNQKTDRAWPLYNTNQFYNALLGRESGVLTAQQAVSARLENLTQVDDYTYAVTDPELSAAIEYTISVQNDGDLYANFPIYTSYCGGMVVLNGQLAATVLTEDANGVAYLGRVQAGDELTVTLIAQSQTLSLAAQEFWVEDPDALAAACATLQAGGLTPTPQDTDNDNDNGNAILAGQFTAADTDREFLLTLPYDTGLRVWVDGARVDCYPAFGALTAFAVTPGTHSLRVTYWPAGLTAGLCLSAAAALAALVWLALHKKNNATLR